jgi:4-amino-4-deoxy-L-arabinose transferase-like glycosyltransferase
MSAARRLAGIRQVSAAWIVEATSLARRRPLLPALLLGLLLRLIGIQGRSLQYDDTFSIFLSERSLPEIVRGTAADTMPPLYYFVLHFWMAVSREAWFVRLLSGLLSLLAIVLLYELGSRWLVKGAAGWAAGLAALSPLLIYHGQDVRMYALLVVCQLGYLWFFTRVWFSDEQRTGQYWNWVGLALCGTAALYTHNVAVFALLAPDLFLLLRREWKLLSRLLAAQLAMALLALPWLLLIPGQVAKVQSAWTLPPPGVVEILQAILMFAASLPLPVPLLALALLFSLQILAMLAIELRRAWKDLPERRAGMAFFLILLLLPPGLLFAASYVIKPVFVPRAFLVASLAYDLLAGLVIARTWSRGVGKLLAAAFLAAALVSLPSFYTYQDFPRSPYRQASAYLQGAVRPGELVIHETKLSFFPARYYAPQLPQVFLADPPGSENDTFEIASQQAMRIFPAPDLASAIGESQAVYFVTFSQTFGEYEAMGLPEHPNLVWLDGHMRRVGRVSFNDLEIYHYER